MKKSVNLRYLIMPLTFLMVAYTSFCILSEIFKIGQANDVLTKFVFLLINTILPEMSVAVICDFEAPVVTLVCSILIAIKVLLYFILPIFMFSKKSPKFASGLLIVLLSLDMLMSFSIFLQNFFLGLLAVLYRTIAIICCVQNIRYLDDNYDLNTV